MASTTRSLLKSFHLGGNAAHFGQVTYPRGGTYGPLRQTCFQVVGILEGRMTAELDKELVQVNEHEAVLLMPGQRVYLRFSEHTPTEHNWGSIGEEALPEEVVQILGPWNGTLSTRMFTLISWAIELGHRPYPGIEHQLDALAVSLMWELARVQQLQKGGHQDERIAKALQYMMAHCAEEIGVEDVARHTSLSLQHLSRLFREQSGESLSRHLWRIRTEKARRLILETGLSLNEIAEDCGFQNPFHLSRKVRERYGKSPRDLRRAFWGDV